MVGKKSYRQERKIRHEQTYLNVDNIVFSGRSDPCILQGNVLPGGVRVQYKLSYASQKIQRYKDSPSV